MQSNPTCRAKIVQSRRHGPAPPVLFRREVPWPGAVHRYQLGTLPAAVHVASSPSCFPFYANCLDSRQTSNHTGQTCFCLLMRNADSNSVNIIVQHGLVALRRRTLRTRTLQNTKLFYHKTTKNIASWNMTHHTAPIPFHQHTIFGTRTRTHPNDIDPTAAMLA